MSIIQRCLYIRLVDSLWLGPVFLDISEDFFVVIMVFGLINQSRQGGEGLLKVL